MTVWARLYRRLTHGSLVGRIVVFLVILSVLWSPFALIFYGLGYYWRGQSDLTNALALVALYLCFIGHAWGWGRWGYGWANPFCTYGLVWRWRFLCELVLALVCGFSLVACLFGVEVWLGWANVDPQPLAAIALEGLAVGLGIGFAEELLFRGWLLTELRIDLSRSQAIVWSSVIFAVAHFIKPLPDILHTSPQFLGLLLLGLILGSSRYLQTRQRPCSQGLLNLRPFGRLSLPIGFHAGLIWGYYIVDVGDLVIPSGQVPEWVTGIHGNPLSGALGVAILGCLTGATTLALVSLRSK